MTAAALDWDESSTGTAVFVGGFRTERERLSEAFGDAGWTAINVQSMASIATILRQTFPDVIVLTDALLDCPLLDAVVELKRTSAIPVVVLLTRGHDPTTAEVALRIGADDVQNATIEAEELRTRIDAILRRRQGSPSTTASYRFDNVVIDTEGRRVFHDGKQVSLAPARFDILVELVSHPHAVRTFAQLHRIARPRVTSVDAAHTAHTVTEHVRMIRLVVESTPHKPQWIRTVRGVGYVFEPKIEL